LSLNAAYGIKNSRALEEQVEQNKGSKVRIDNYYSGRNKINRNNYDDGKHDKSSLAYFFSRASNPLAIVLQSNSELDAAAKIFQTTDTQLLLTFACSFGVFIAVGTLFTFHLHLGESLVLFEFLSSLIFI
jgi:hypothetical protein